MSRGAVAPETITVKVPFRFAKRGGRKEMQMPSGAPAKRVPPDSTLIKALARAFRWKQMLDSGEFATIGDLAAHDKIAPSYLTRVLRLTLLSPATVEAIIDGNCTAGLANLLEPFPVCWQDQMAGRR